MQRCGIEENVRRKDQPLFRAAILACNLKKQMPRIHESANLEGRPLLRGAAIMNRPAMIMVIHHHLRPSKIVLMMDRRIPRLPRRKPKNKKRRRARCGAIIARDHIESEYARTSRAPIAKKKGTHPPPVPSDY